MNSAALSPPKRGPRGKGVAGKRPPIFMLHTVPSFWRRAVSGGGAREREVSLSLSGSLRPSLLWERTISLVSFSSIKVRRVPSSGRYRTPSRGTSLPAPRGLLPYSGHLVEEKKKSDGEREYESACAWTCARGRGAAVLVRPAVRGRTCRAAVFASNRKCVLSE